MKHALFFFRLALFLAISIAPALYPGIVLPFDAAALWRCFALVPACMAIGFWGRRMPRAFGVPLEPLALAALVVSTASLTGLTADFFWCVSWGAIAWIGSWLAFRKGLPLALAPEPILALWFAARITSFGRSSERMAEACLVPGIVIATGCALAWGVYAFLTFALANESGGKRRRPGMGAAAGFTVALVALLCAALVWFPDSVPQFVRELNDANRQLKPVPPEGDGYPRRQSQGSDPSRQGGSAGGPGGLFESDSKDWLNGKGGGSGGNQYLVMVVESPVPSLYLAENYLERLDSVEGFRADPANPYNSLAAAPLLETWENPEHTYDYGREAISVNVYSCVPKKFMSWLPQRVEPVVQDRRYAPLQYTYRAESLVSLCSIQGVEPDTFPLSEEERAGFAPYLETSLAPADLAAFQDYAKGLYSDEDMPATRVDGILMGLSGCQYRLGMKDDVSVAALRDFLFETKTGDCSEFSNTAALLARLAGVPSRVVTGYTVQRDLQSPSHVAGIKRLITTFPPLAGKDPDSLYLVTTAHRHSWPQFYFSGWGWVDYESTKYAIPPEQGFDPNNMDIVIPKIDEAPRLRPRATIPWLLLAKLAACAAVFAVAFSLVRRWVILGSLSVASRASGERGAKASFRLFLVWLAAAGYRPKARGETPAEYAAYFTELAPIAALYERAVLHPDATEREIARSGMARGIRDFRRARRGLATVVRFAFGPRGGSLL